MARLTKTDAARQLGIARATLYKLIAQGKVSPTPDGLIDQAELIRVAPYIDALHERTRTPTDSRERPQPSTVATPENTYNTTDIHGEYGDVDVYERSQTRDHRRLQTDVYERLQTSTDTIVDMLREQLRLMQDREREQARLYEERERDYREHIAHLTAMLDQAHQQNQRLLEMPRTPPPPPAYLVPLQGPPGAQGPDPRGAMRRRILALLQDYPDGLTPAEIRARLGVDRSLADTLLGMLRYGLVQRVGYGRYVVAAPS